jgi:pimeloyl-ACP methyl ester carboxylesterase
LQGLKNFQSHWNFAFRFTVSTVHSSLHPVRWAAIILVSLPVFLLVASAAASLKQHKEALHFLLHWLRYALLTEVSLVLILATWGAIYERVSQARDLHVYPPPGKLIDVGGYKLHLYCTGQGSPTVVLEHGLDGSYLDWRLVQPEIARFTRVCSYDRAGYGWSDRSPKARLPSVMVEELHSLLKNAGERAPFIVVAHSMGAFNAIMYAHLYPREVSAIVLVDGSHPDELLPFRWKQKVSLRFLQVMTPFGLPRWRKWCGGRDKALQPWKAAVNCKARVFGTRYQQWSAYPDAAAEISKLEKSLTVPLVVISRDPARGRPSTEQRWMELQKKLLQLSPNSRQVVAEDSGHGIPGQRPDVIVDVVRRLVEQMTQPGPELRAARPL